MWGMMAGGEMETLCLYSFFKKPFYKGEQQKELSKKGELVDILKMLTE